MNIDAPKVQIVRDSCNGLDLVGKKITHKQYGECIVVGYSNISGSPAVFFYDVPKWNDKLVFVDEKNLILD